MNIKKYTPENITELEKNEIFVYGDNEGHIHGAGAALQALKFGAIHGQGFRIIGNTYGIPTKSKIFFLLCLDEIKNYVDDFLSYIVKTNPDKNFLITKIGTGLSGYSIEDIAPLFERALFLPNCFLPEEFVNIILKNITYEKFKAYHLSLNNVYFKEGDLQFKGEIKEFSDEERIKVCETETASLYTHWINFEDLILY